MAEGDQRGRLTVAGLWTEGIALVRMHSASLLWVAAMFLFLPQLALDLFAPAKAGAAMATRPAFGSLLAALIAIYGQIAIAGILLGGANGPQTVGDALRRAFHLVPRILLALLMIIGILIPVAFVAALLAASLGGAPTAAQMAKPTPAMLTLVLPFVVGALYVAARISTLIPTLFAEERSAWRTLARAWGMTSGSTLPLLGFLFTLGFAVVFTTGLIKLVGDVLVSLVFGKAAIASLLLSTLLALVSTGFSLISQGAGVVAYRKLSQ